MKSHSRSNPFDLVGVPYAVGGLTPETGFACFGLVRYVLNTERGMNLPEHAPQAFAWPRYVTVYHRPFPKLQKYDVLMFDEIIPGLVNHIGIMISSTDFLHTGEAFGSVVCQPVELFRDRIMAIGRPK